MEYIRVTKRLLLRMISHLKRSTSRPKNRHALSQAHVHLMQCLTMEDGQSQIGIKLNSHDPTLQPNDRKASIKYILHNL